MADDATLIRRLWALLNARAFEEAGRLLHPEVDWEGILEGQRLHGPAEVIAYWERMMAYVRPESAIIDLQTRPDGGVAVRLSHVLRRPGGAFWGSEDVTQVFRFDDGRIIRMDAEDA